MKLSFFPFLFSLLIAIAGVCGLPQYSLADFSRVLVVHSYHPEYDWVQGVNLGLAQGFEGSGINVTTMYMDTKNHPSASWKRDAAKRVLRTIDESDPDIVIAVDDNSLQAVTPLMGRDRPAIVFSGINSEPSFYSYPPANVTGIYERTYIHQTLSLIRTLIPEVRRIAYLNDDSVTGMAVLHRMKLAQKQGSLELELIGFDTPPTFSRWKDVIRSHEARDDVGAYLIPVYHTVQDENGDVVLPADVMKWTVEHVTKPIFGLWPFSVEDGALAAVTVDPREHGWVAARMAKEIASGVKPDEIDTEVNREGRVMLNLKSAEFLGIEITYDTIESCDILIE